MLIRSEKGIPKLIIHLGLPSALLDLQEFLGYNTHKRNRNYLRFSISRWTSQYVETIFWKGLKFHLKCIPPASDIIWTS